MIKKVIAGILLITFSWSQIVYAGGAEFLVPHSVQPIQSAQTPELEPSSQIKSQNNGQTTDHFLEEGSPLSSVISTDGSQYDYERYEFQDALDLLRPEYATALILKDLRAEDLKRLVNLGFETGILVLHGEIVLFTSGSEDEVGVMPAVQVLTEKASFISHTHPTIYANEGPSGQDINEAAEAPGEEYVITHKGVYAYNAEGMLNDGKAYSYEGYIEKIKEALSSSNDGNVLARAELNQFIAEQDRYNQAPEEERVTLRRGGTLTYASGLTTSNVTTLSGNPYPYFTPGSSSGTQLSYNSSQFVLNYSVPAAGDLSGFTISFDNASTAAVETQSISALGSLIFGMKGPNTSVQLEIVDSRNVKDTFTLTNISNSAERFWKIPVASISNALDKTKIKTLNFVVNPANTPAASRTGALLIRTKGLTTAIPGKPVLTSNVPAVTNASGITLSGTKEANTSILINNIEVAARDSATVWSAVVSLAAEGDNTFNLTAKNSIGGVSKATGVTIKRDSTGPTGSINISGNALYALSPNITLNLSASDAGAGIDKMSFSIDGSAWTTPETYAASKPFVLPAGDGSKTVSVKFYDKLGNGSAVYSKSVTLDTTPPVVQVLSANRASSAAYTLLYQADGIQKQKAFTLNPGQNTLAISETDTAGNTTAVNFNVEYIQPPLNAFYESSGLMVLEAEHPSQKIMRNLKSWEPQSSTAGYAGEGYLTAGPDTGKSYDTASDYLTRSPELQYAVNFKSAGTYYVWLRALATDGGSDSVHVGLDGQAAAASDRMTVTAGAGFVWTKSTMDSARASLNITGVGVHTLNVWMREDGFILDRILLTTDPNFTPSALGPAESFYGRTLEDGTKLGYQGQTLVSEITPDGHTVNYRPDGSVSSFVYASGEKLVYLPVISSLPNGTIPVFTEASAQIEIHDAQGLLKERIPGAVLPVTSAPDLTNAICMTLENGIEVYYVNGKPVEFRTPTGIRVTDFTLDAANQIIDATIFYPDGRREIMRKGSLLRRIGADGTVTDFTPQGFAVREIGKETAQYFFYEKQSQVNITSTRIFTAQGEAASYDELGILRSAGEGTVSGKYFSYDRAAEAGGYKTHLNTASSSMPDAKTLVEAHYSASGALLQMTLKDGTRIFLSDGRVVKALDTAGQETAYAYQETQGNVSSLEVRHSGTIFGYDSTGFLKSIKTENGTIQRTPGLTDSQTVEILLDETGGNRLTDFELDAGGTILKGILETREGIQQTIENGILTGFQTADGKKYVFQNNEAVLKEWSFADGLRVLYGDAGKNISEIIFPDGRRLNAIGFTADKKIESYTETLPDGTIKTFRNNTLAELFTPSGAHLFYGNSGMAERMVLPDSSEQKIIYSRDAAGALQGITFENAGSRRSYLPDGTLVSILTGGVSAEIINGKIANLSTQFAEAGSPVFDGQGLLSGTVEFTDGTRQIIENGKLVRSLRPNGSIVDYENGKISAIETQGGRYELLYAENTTGDLQNAQIRLASEQGKPVYPLIPYLLNPRELEMAPFYRDDFFSPAGNAQSSSSVSKFGSSSARFDGGGDYLQIPDGSNADFQYGEGDFTIDFWFQANTPAGSQQLWSQYRPGSGTDAIKIFLENGKLGAHLEKGGQAWGGLLSGTAALQAGTWYHAALVRNGSHVALYLNGQKQAEAAVSGNAPSGAFMVSAGSTYSGSGWIHSLNGAMDEIRISKGTARWTSNFTPPSQESRRDAFTVRLWHFLTAADEPPSDPELNQILLGRSTADLFSNPLELQTGISVDGQAANAALAGYADDPERGRVYRFSGSYSPVWSNLQSGTSLYDQGYLSQSRVLDTHDNLPALTSDLVDITGDGIADRVWMPASASDSFWWMQAGNGSGFNDPVEWSGVERKYDPDFSAISGESQGALRFYSGRRPNVLGDLVDINGDRLPDRLLQKTGNAPEWYVQINNGDGFDPIQLWAANVQPLSLGAIEGSYASEVREDNGVTPLEPLIADLRDMDGDGLADRILRPYVAPFDHWFYQKNNGSGFDEAVLWTGVDLSFDLDPKMGGSISWFREDSGMIADLSDLVDMNGDNRPDRVLLKLKNPANDFSGYDWYVQFNHGTGFDAPVLWDSEVRNMPAYGTKTGTALRVFDFSSSQGGRSTAADLVDVTGDGLPDRVTVDQYSNNYGASAVWWVEINNGKGFAPAVAWTGIEGANAAETSLGQDDSHFRSFGAYANYGREPGFVQNISGLQDLNGDKIPDRIVFKEGEGKWQVQYGTGHGFLPAKEMKIESLAASSAQISASRYDYLHVSLRADSSLTSAQGSVRVILNDTENSGDTIVQEWTISNLTSVWQNFYLPVDESQFNASQVKIEFIPASSASSGIPLYVDNMTFVNVRPNAAKDWTARMLAEEGVISEMNSSRTTTLTDFLREVIPGDPLAPPQEEIPGIDWEKLLSAESKIKFNASGEAGQFETLYGTVSKIENGRVAESTLADGSTVTAQQIIHADGSVENLQLSYGRVRTVSRPGKSPLQYSYEFTADGTEITVVLDPDSGVTERYAGSLLVSRTEANGVATAFEYEGDQITRSLISYKDRVLHSLNYESLGTGRRLVRNEQGILEEYNDAGQILSHTTPEGYRYSHTFEKAKKVITTLQSQAVSYADGTSANFQVPVVTLVDDPEGEDVHRVSLAGYETAAGEHAEYENGILKSALLADGTRIVITGSRSIQEPLDVLVFYPDGTVTEFKDGKPYSVTSASGRIVSLAMEKGELTDPHESAQFHYQEAIKLWNALVRPRWDALQVPADLPINMELSAAGVLLTRQFAEGTIELYAGDSGGKIQQIVSPDGEVLIQYTYDAEGNPTRVEMGGARRRLESVVLKLKAEVAVDQETALAQVADRRQVLSQTIEGQYLVARDRLLAIRSQIEAQQNQIVSLNIKGKQARAALGDAVGQIQAGLDQLNGALAGLANQRIAALENLSSQVQEVSFQIYQQAQDSYAQLEAENQKARGLILKQEMTAVIFHWYRKILGRDPSASEYDRVIQSADYAAGIFNLEGFKASLLGSSELAARSAQVAEIKLRVTSLLRHYLMLSNPEKLAFASGLGIDAGPALNSGEAESILAWLNTRSLHFGQSAFLALEALLAQAGIPFNRIDLAVSLILIDILTGTLTPLESETGSDLILSVYALKTYAAKLGLQTYAFNMNYDALKANYDQACPPTVQNCSFRMIAHIQGNHYVVLTRVTDSEITYIDPGIGPEGSVEIQTLSKEEFLQVWINSGIPGSGLGVVMSTTQGPQGTVNAKALTISEQMRVRGAFFGVLFKIFRIIFNVIFYSITPLEFSVQMINKDFKNALQSQVDAFGDFFENLFTFDFSNAWGAVKAAFSAGISVGKALLNITPQVLGATLEKIGVPPEVTQTILSGVKLVAGVVLLIVPGGQGFGAGLIAGGVSELLTQHTNLSPAMKSIISLGAAAVAIFAGGGIDAGNLAGAVGSLKSAAPFFAREFASAGLVAVGNAIGLDPRLTSLISIPVSAAIGAGANRLVNGPGTVVGFRGDGTQILVRDSRGILDYVKDEAFSSNAIAGMVAVGADIGLGAAGAPPLARDFVSGFLGSVMGGNSSSLGRSVLSKIGEGIRKFGQAAVNAAGAVVHFGQKILGGIAQVTAEGFKKAVSAFSGIFSRQTQEGIYKDETALAGGSVTKSGNVWSYQAGGSVLEYDTQTDTLTETFGAGGKARIQGLSQDSSGGFYYTKLTYEQAIADQQSYYEIFENGRLTEWGYSENELSIVQVKNNSSRAWQGEGDWLDQADVEIHVPPSEIQGPDSIFLRLKFLSGYVAEASVQAKPAKAFQANEDKHLDKNLYVLVNGIDPNETKEGYMHNLQGDLATQSQFQVDPRKDVVVPFIFAPGILVQAFNFLFQNNLAQVKTALRQIADIYKLIQEQKGGGQLTQDVIAAIDVFAQQNGAEQLLRKMVGVGYSGGFVPLVEAMIKEGYNAASIVALGGSTLAIGSVLAKAIAGFIQQMEKLATARDQVTRDAYKTSFQILGAILNGIPGNIVLFAAIDLFLDQLDGFYDTLSQSNLSQKVDEFYEGLCGLIQQMSGYTWGPVENTKAGLMVNLWGSEDVLAKIGVSGYRSSIGGYSIHDRNRSLFNIEIEGADHYDYVYGVHDFEKDFPDPIKRAAAEAKNKTVSDFVSKTILQANNADDFRKYMARLQGDGVAYLTTDNIWKIKL